MGIIVVATFVWVARIAHAERVDPWVDQHPSSATVRDLLGMWQFAWFPGPDHGGIEVEVDLVTGTKTIVSIGRRSSLMLSGSLGVVNSAVWDLEDGQWHVGLDFRAGSNACGNALLEVRSADIAGANREKEYAARILNITTLHRSDLEDIDTFIGKPRCGKRMVEQVEVQSRETVITCVDRPYTRAASLAQLVIVLEHGLPKWVMSPAPFEGDPVDDGSTDPPGPDPLYWPMPPTCHPLFAERDARKLAWPRHNMAIAFDWMSDVDLLSLQSWQDDEETGYFVLLNSEGRPATIGYRFQGLAHGIWYYLNPDGSLHEARLYALDVMLERLPIETLPAR